MSVDTIRIVTDSRSTPTVSGVSVHCRWYIAYATKSCELSQGLEMKNPSMWQEESAVVPTFFMIFCSPKITNLRKQQAPKAANFESNEGPI